MDRIPVAKPKLTGNERRYVLDCLDTNWISSLGKYIGAFEAGFAEFCGVRHAISTNNGTTALHLAMAALGLEAGDEVIVPTVTYIATANAVRYCGATPVFVDVLPNTLNLDPAQIESKITSRTRGIIPVHLYGHPAEMEAINETAARHGLWVVEDAAEAHGAEIDGRKAGSFGTCGAFSFFGNKIITTGEGGMLTTNDDELAARMRLLRGQGMDPQRRYWFPVVGYNYRMTNIQAAIGLAQLEEIDAALAARRQLAAWYNEALGGLVNHLALPSEVGCAKHAYWMYTVYLIGGGEARRDALMSQLAAQGIETRPVFYPMHVLPPYKCREDFPIADTWAARGINLPTHLDISKDDTIRIAKALAEAIALD